MFLWKQGSSIEVAGHSLAGDDLMLKRGFKGDTDVFQASVSEDGKIMVVLDTRKDEKVDAVVIALFYFLQSESWISVPFYLSVAHKKFWGGLGLGLTRSSRKSWPEK